MADYNLPSIKDPKAGPSLFHCSRLWTEMPRERVVPCRWFRSADHQSVVNDQRRRSFPSGEMIIYINIEITENSTNLCASITHDNEDSGSEMDYIRTSVSNQLYNLNQVFIKPQHMNTTNFRQKQIIQWCKLTVIRGKGNSWLQADAV